MDAIYTLARTIIDTNYEKLPPDVVDMTKKQILDSLGVAVAGSSGVGINELLEIVRDWGGKKESSIWVYGDKLPCITAAQVNATMIHALDFDDTHDVAILHPSAAVVPTGFAIAERLGGINGKKLITAVALGVDLVSRLCLATTVPMAEHGWHFTALHGGFGAAAVAGKLLGLDEETLVNAFGIAYHQAGGNLLCIDDGAITKRTGPGFSARNGIMAALMAQKGITGAKNVLQGSYGLFNVYHRGNYNPEVLTANLGEKFEGINVSFKPYPCCRYSHSAIDAVLAMVRQHNIEADDVDSVIIYISKGCWDLLCEPLDIKKNPRNTVDSQFSLPWSVATAITRGKVGIANFTAQAIKDNVTLALSNRVTPKLDESLRQKGIQASIVEIKTKGGEVYSKHAGIPYGNPKNPMIMEDLIEKFRECVSYAAEPIPKSNVERGINLILNLEKVDDISQVIRLFTKE